MHSHTISLPHNQEKVPSAFAFFSLSPGAKGHSVKLECARRTESWDFLWGSCERLAIFRLAHSTGWCQILNIRKERELLSELHQLQLHRWPAQWTKWINRHQQITINQMQIKTAASVLEIGSWRKGCSYCTTSKLRQYQMSTRTTFHQSRHSGCHQYWYWNQVLFKYPAYLLILVKKNALESMSDLTWCHVMQYLMTQMIDDGDRDVFHN